jgi:cobalt transporter subunit CbtA
MITRVLGTGLLAGLIAGLCVAVLQAFTTTPLILEAEIYEKAQEAPQQGVQFLVPRAHKLLQQTNLVLVHADAHAHDGEGGEAWAPRDGLERTVYASVATIATAVGFALMLLGGMLLARDPIDEGHAMAWAAAAFVATGLAPAVGLSPEVPGMVAAELSSRQAWWFMTAAMTALALWLFLRSEPGWLRLAAVPLLLAPHIWGAPHLADPPVSSVPAHLAAQFAATSLAVQAILWMLTGFFVGFLWRRLGAGDVRPTA